MKNRLFAILIVVGLAVAVAGCASENQRESYRNEILLPRQTGSNFNRRFMEEEITPRKKTKKKRPDSTKPSKKPEKPEKPAKMERTEPERTEPERPAETPTPAPPDRFR